MPRDFFINGESLVKVKGRADSAIGSIQELGLTEDQIHVVPVSQYEDLSVNAYGFGRVPPDVQYFLTEVQVTMTLIHYDQGVLEACIQESMCAGTPGAVGRTGQRLGNNLPRFASGGTNGNHYIGLNILSPVANVPYRFLTAYIMGGPIDIDLGTEKSRVRVTWRVIPYAQDPWGSGTGSLGNVLWDHTLDT